MSAHEEALGCAHPNRRSKDNIAVIAAAKSGDRFTKFPEWLWGQFSPTTTLVYLALYSFAWMPDGARPSIKTVAAKVGVSPSTVNRSICQLVNAGVLIVTPRFDDAAGKQPLPNHYSFPGMPGYGTSGSGTESPGIISEKGPVIGDGRGPVIHEGRVPSPVTAEVDECEEDSVKLDAGLDWAASGGQRYVGESQAKEPGGQGSLGEDKTPGRISPTKYSVFNKPLSDPAVEQQAVEIVDLLNDLRVRANQNPVTETGRQGWLKSARILLFSHRRSFHEVCTLIRWGCEDEYWSGRITSVYKLQESYNQILQESQCRKPRRSRRMPGESQSRRMGVPPSGDASHGFSKLTDLGGNKACDQFSHLPAGPGTVADNPEANSGFSSLKERLRRVPLDRSIPRVHSVFGPVGDVVDVGHRCSDMCMCFCGKTSCGGFMEPPRLGISLYFPGDRPRAASGAVPLLSPPAIVSDGG